MKPVRANIILMVSILAGSLLFPASAGALNFTHLYNLSDFTGTVPYSEVNLFVDRQTDEVYATVGNSVRIFNASGMQVYQFDHDPVAGRIFDLAVDEAGDILLLTLEAGVTGLETPWSITRCDYRGVPIDRIRVSGIPPEFDPFLPNVMFYREGQFYLASRARLQVVVVDLAGEFLQAYDLAPLIGVGDDQRGDNDIAGFDLDQNGNLLFTIPTRFQAFVVSPEGVVRTFGRSGSAPGSFGIVAGITGDEHGRVYVADKLRNVLMVFNKDLEFVTEYGSRNGGRSALVRPTDLVSGVAGRLYVTQARNRGVAVFQIVLHEEEEMLATAAWKKGGEAIRTETQVKGGNHGTVNSAGPGKGKSAPVGPSGGGSGTKQMNPLASMEINSRSREGGQTK